MFFTITSLLYESEPWVNFHPVKRGRLGWTEIKVTTVTFADLPFGSILMLWFPKCGWED